MAKVLENITPRSNGQDVPLDPRIVKTVHLLDQVLRAQDPTIGVVVAAVGVLLGAKVMNSEQLERMVGDLSMATRVGYYITHNKEK